MAVRGLIVGASGQDGPYLAEVLANRGIEAWGLVPSWDPRRTTVAERAPKLNVIEADLLDPYMPIRVLDHVQPKYVFNLAAVTFVPSSWTQVELTVQSNGVAPVRILEAIRELKLDAKFYQASTAEMYGSSPPRQSEETPFRPVSPYAASKLLAHHAVEVYRQSYGMFAVSGILFNHESPWRGDEFVTRQVTMAVARWLTGDRTPAPIGNVHAVRDWGYAGDYVKAMMMMVDQDDPVDYVIGTGIGRTVRTLMEVACAAADLDPDEVFYEDKERFRPVETADLVADARRAVRELKWWPGTSFEKMIEEMMIADVARCKERS